MLIRDEIQFKLLHILQEEPQLSQRELAKRMGVSLGMTNFCLKALMDKGLIKARNFLESGQKNRYLYQLTPQGIANKAQITRDFLARKRAEYRAIQAEIRALEATLQAETATGTGTAAATAAAATATAAATGTAAATATEAPAHAAGTMSSREAEKN